MSFLDGILSVGKSAVKFISGSSILSGLARTAILGLAVRKLSQNALKGSDAGSQPNIDAGVRLQVKPDASAKIPVLYGGAFFGGNVSDAALANANKTMWYSLVLCEKTGTVYSTGSSSSYTLNNVYWNNQRIIFNADGVTVNYTVDSSGIIDRNLSGLVKVYFYAGGRTAGQVPSGYTGTVPNAETLFPNWTSGTHAMNNLVFAIVRVDYNREKGVTGLGNMLFQVTNSMLYPGDVLYDYLTNTTYGAGITGSDILTADITALNTYSQDSVAYDSPTGAATLADRYQINGLIDTDNPVLENAEKILSAAASWLSYDAHDGKWGIVINKSASSVASFNDTNILGTISISGTGLQDLYNSTKVEFPHRELRDSADFYNIAVPTSSIPADWTPFSRNANEEDKVLPLSYDIINEPIQAQMLGLIELKQSRLDKVIQFQTDFSYYNLKAGDIIDVTNTRFGFSSSLFRIITINEVQDEGGALIMEITALQYNTNVYSIADLYRFVRTTADGIVSIGSIGQPGTPVVTKIEQDSRPRTEITSTAPTGVVEGMEFWITTDTGIVDDSLRSYTLVGVKKPVGGGVFTSGTSVLLEYVPNAGNFYVKTRGFNAQTVGSFSAVSGLVEFAPVQTTDAITPNTDLLNSTGGLLGALALIDLLTKVSELFPSGSGSKSLFDRIFEVFSDETGVDLVGQASGGSLVVDAAIETKADGASLGATTNSYDFIGPIEASGSSDIEVKLTDGVKNKDVLAWNKDEQKWQPISDCIECDFENLPPADGPTEPCKITLSTTFPSNNFNGTNTSTLCPPSTSVPFIGSYFAKFQILPGRKAVKPALASTISPTTAYQYTIAKAGNTDFSWWGAPNNTVGTKWFATSTSSNFPNGKTVKEITVGKRYKILTLKKNTDTSTTEEVKAAWEAVGWTGATANSNPVVNDEFTATAVGTGTGTVGFVAGTGWVYGQGVAETAISLVAPLAKGAGSFKLYGTDGVLEQTLPVASCVVWNDVIELPFKPRSPGKDYYIVWDEGVVTNCSCENIAVDNATTWTFTTSEIPVDPYLLSSISPTFIASTGETSDQFVRSRLDYSVSPTRELCASSQKLIFTFSGKVIKGTGSVTIKDRLAGTTVATLGVASATLTYTTNPTTGAVISTKVDFGTIPTLTQDKFFDVTAPLGLLVTESVAGTSTYCDVTTLTPAPPQRQSRAKTWGLKTTGPLKIVKVEYCANPDGGATKRANIRITFNKPIKVKSSSPAEITIYENGSVFQKIDLRGTYANKKYGDIYDAVSSAADNPDTGNVETASNRVVVVNPTKMFKGGSNYYINFGSGVIIDSGCEIDFPAVTDATTIAWRTDGVTPIPPQGLTYGSVKLIYKVDRKVVAGYGKVNIVTPAGKLKTQVDAKDIAVKLSHNTPL
ncbi:hypothetical protein UFOVP322_8 [uncultured Caudovirales phage]|uniref:Tip attachment protein J n=1 Tax=uncultured Caudovirales phage TaxID=2100421 RepID=A0A6J5LVE9_9CAUD|nr:hypothetical protein UFOVP322_8 [uncultured Caudovirales phage]CAB4160575.1 hypothetical protein UFOVP771_6 [uncultured Caudovirales phage]CAB4166001.1 hypothetical protein UFOVP850_6 [uncultured Caudovirales phage]